MSLVAQYRLQENSGTTIYDDVGTNDGTWAGTDVVTNGAMTNLSGWTQTGIDYLWNPGSSRCDYAQSGTPEDRVLSQDVGGVSGKEYEVSVTIVASVVGSLNISLGLGATPTVISSVAIHTFSAVWGGSDSTLYIEGDAGGDISFKDVSVRENVSSVSSPAGSGLLFDGVGDNIAIPDSPSFDAVTTVGTISAWVKGTSGIGVTNIFRSGETGHKWLLQVGGNNKFLFYIIAGTTVSIEAAETVVAGDWYHVACTWTTGAGNMKMYVNGVLEADTGTQPAAFLPVYEEVNIGSQSGVSGFFDGSISDVRLYDTALSASEIRILANNRGLTSPFGYITNIRN